MINGAFCAVFHNLTLTHCPAHALLVLFLKLYFWRASPNSGVIFYMQETTIFWLHLFFVANFELCTKFHLMKIRMYFYRTRVRSLAMLVTNWLTDSCLVNLIDVTLVCEDAYSKLVEIVTVAGVKDRVGNSLLQIWKLMRFGQKAKLLFQLWAQGLVKILKLKLRQELKQEFGHFFLLMFCRGYEVESWSRFWS